MAIPYTALGSISFCFSKVFFNGVAVAMTSFSSCSTNHPVGVKFDFPPGEPLNQKYNFGLHRCYIVEDPLEAVSIFALVPILALFSYNGDFKVSGAGRV